MAYQESYTSEGFLSNKMHVHHKPTFIKFKGIKFLITECPSQANLSSYIKELQRRNVTTLVRVCEPSYKLDDLLKTGIVVHDLCYMDGTRPSPMLIEQWFQIVQNHYDRTPEKCIAVHCVAGLGRAPVMVALSLIELGLSSEYVIEVIRRQRQGAFNLYQLDFLKRYRPKSRLRVESRQKSNTRCCIQ